MAPTPSTSSTGHLYEAVAHLELAFGSPALFWAVAALVIVLTLLGVTGLVYILVTRVRTNSLAPNVVVDLESGGKTEAPEVSSDSLKLRPLILSSVSIVAKPTSADPLACGTTSDVSSDLSAGAKPCSSGIHDISVTGVDEPTQAEEATSQVLNPQLQKLPKAVGASDIIRHHDAIQHAAGSLSCSLQQQSMCGFVREAGFKVQPGDRDAILRDLEIGLKQAYKPRQTRSTIVYWLSSIFKKSPKAPTPVIMLTTPEGEEMKLKVDKIVAKDAGRQVQSKLSESVSGGMDVNSVLTALYGHSKRRQVVHDPLIDLLTVPTERRIGPPTKWKIHDRHPMPCTSLSPHMVSRDDVEVNEQPLANVGMRSVAEVDDKDTSLPITESELSTPELTFSTILPDSVDTSSDSCDIATPELVSSMFIGDGNDSNSSEDDYIPATPPTLHEVAALSIKPTGKDDCLPEIQFEGNEALSPADDLPITFIVPSPSVDITLADMTDPDVPRIEVEDEDASLRSDSGEDDDLSAYLPPPSPVISSFAEVTASSSMTLPSEHSTVLSLLFTAKLPRNSYLFVPPPGDPAYFQSSEWTPPLPSITGKPFKLQAPPKGKGRGRRASMNIGGETGIATDIGIGREGITKEVKVDKAVNNSFKPILEEISEDIDDEVEAMQQCPVSRTESEGIFKYELSDDTLAIFPTAAGAETVDEPSTESGQTTLDAIPGSDAPRMGSYWSEESLLDEPSEDLVTRVVRTLKPSKMISSRGIVVSKALRPLPGSQRPSRKAISHLHLNASPAPCASDTATQSPTPLSDVTPIRPRRPAPWTSSMARAELFIQTNESSPQGASWGTPPFLAPTVTVGPSMDAPSTAGQAPFPRSLPRPSVAWPAQTRASNLDSSAVTRPSPMPSTPARNSSVPACQDTMTSVSPKTSSHGHNTPPAFASPARTRPHTPTERSPPRAPYSPPRFQSARRSALSTPTESPPPGHHKPTTSSSLKSTPLSAPRTPLSRKQRSRMGMVFGEDGRPSSPRRLGTANVSPIASSSPPTGTLNRTRSPIGSIPDIPAVPRPPKSSKPIQRRVWV